MAAFDKTKYKRTVYETESVYHVPDFKHPNGDWVMSTYELVGRKEVRQYTRAYGVWRDMQQRLKKGSLYQDIENRFDSFQLFADWCQDEYGYLNKDEHGRFWALDKDLLAPNSKMYSPETCAFIPTKMNVMFNKREKSNGLPLGVYADGREGYYKSIINRKHLGIFKDAVSAHVAWQSEKLIIVQTYLETFHEDAQWKIRQILDNKINQLKHDIENKQETIWR